MASTLIAYRAARILLRGMLSLYFRKIEFSGREHVPKRAPLLLAANHPHSITDALVLGISTGRPVHYLAHSGLFKGRLRGAFLKRCGVIPIYRPNDESEAGSKNTKTFEACTALLRRGGIIGIFPEGTSQQERRLQKMRTGVARIALESEQEHNFQLGIVIIPVGLNFESQRRFRTRVLVSFGQAIETSDYREAFEKDPYETVHELTAELGKRIRAIVVNLERSELDGLVDEISRTYRSELKDRRDVSIEGESNFQQGQTLLREIACAVDYFYDRDPEGIWQLQQKLHDYRRQLEHMRVSDAMIREGARPDIRMRWIRLTIWAIVGAPFGVYGILTNYLPYWITGKLAHRATADLTKFHYFQLVIGALLYLLYYPPLLWLVWHYVQPGAIRFGVLVVSLPSTGLFARIYVARLIRERRMLRYAALTISHGAALQQLRMRRRSLIGVMDMMLAEYLLARDSDEAADPLQ